MPNLPVPTHDLFAWHRALRVANTREEDGVAVVEVVLSRQALALAFLIGTFMNGDGTTPARWSPGLDKLSDALGYPVSNHRKAVSRLISELEEAGYLIVTRRGGRFTPNLYTAAVPAHRAAAPADDRVGHDAGSSRHPAEGAAPTPPSAPSSAALTSLTDGSGASFAAANSATHAAHPSLSFSTPFPARGGQGTGTAGGRPVVAKAPLLDGPDTTATKKLFQTALSGMPHEAAHELMAAVSRLPNRFELAGQVNALCDLGATDKLVAELAKPYHGARQPAAVAASRVRTLWQAHGRPALR